MHNLANELNESVVLNTIKANKAYVAYYVSKNNSELEVKFDSYAQSSIYSLATGRLLLAYQPSEELDIYVKENGLPQNNWDNINNINELKKSLNEIKEK